MEGDHTINGNLKIDLTIKSFLTDICKYLNILCITGYVIIGMFIIKIISYKIIKDDYLLLYKSNRKLYDFINDFYFGRSYVILMMAIVIFIILIRKYHKTLKMVLANNIQDDLIESFYRLKLIFRFFSIFTILGFVMYSFYLLMDFYSLTYH